MTQTKECPNCKSKLDDDESCPNCEYGHLSVATTTTSYTINVMETSVTMPPPRPTVSKFSFNVGGKLFELENLNDDMNALFRARALLH